MSNEVKPVSLKDGMIVLLRALEKGPVTYGKLRIQYFGIGRSENPSNTAYNTKKNEAVAKGLIQKAVVGFELTELGRVSIEAISAEVKAAAKSEAEKRFDESAAGKEWHAKNPTPAPVKVAADFTPKSEREAEAEAQAEADANLA